MGFHCMRFNVKVAYICPLGIFPNCYWKYCFVCHCVTVVEELFFCTINYIVSLNLFGKLPCYKTKGQQSRKGEKQSVR